jgi:hypothetical protein
VLGSICSVYGRESTRIGISKLVERRVPTKKGERCMAVAQPGLGR